jgi:hypothetical protein
MRLISVFVVLLRKAIHLLVILALLLPILFIAYMGNQPMNVPAAPKGLTYWQFLGDRIDAAKSVQPSRCGWGMMFSLGLLGPIYSVVYTDVAIHPQGFLAKVTSPDTDIPRDVAGTSWNEVPGIWWNVVERLSWTMLAKPHVACNMRAVQSAKK